MKVKKPRKNFVPLKRVVRHQDKSRRANEQGAVDYGASLRSDLQEATEASYAQDQTRETGRGSKPKNWETFVKETRELLEPTASGKGYNSTGVDGKNELFEFVSGIAGPGHALGEIVYKAVRYKNKHQEDDLLKIAAWAYLIWRFGK